MLATIGRNLLSRFQKLRQRLPVIEFPANRKVFASPRQRENYEQPRTPGCGSGERVARGEAIGRLTGIGVADFSSLIRAEGAQVGITVVGHS